MLALGHREAPCVNALCDEQQQRHNHAACACVVMFAVLLSVSFGEKGVLLMKAIEFEMHTTAAHAAMRLVPDIQMPMCSFAQALVQMCA